jgi:hypothetical protein
MKKLIFLIIFIVFATGLFAQGDSYGHGSPFFIATSSDTTGNPKDVGLILALTGTDTTFFFGLGSYWEQIALWGDSAQFTNISVDTINGYSTDNVYFNDDVVVLQNLEFEGTSSNSMTFTNSSGDDVIIIDPNRTASEYEFYIDVTERAGTNIFPDGGPYKTYIFNVEVDREAANDATGDSRDAMYKGVYRNYGQNDNTHNMQGIGVSVRNESGGTGGSLKAGEFGVNNKSGATITNQLYGLTSTVENYGTPGTDIIAGRFDLRNEGTNATNEWGIHITNTNNSQADAADAAIYVDDSGANTGWDYGLQFDGATIGTAEILGTQGETWENVTTNGLWTSNGGIDLATKAIVNDSLRVEETVLIKGAATLNDKLVVLDSIRTNGSTKTSTFQMTTGATADYYLKSDASGNGSWSVVDSTWEKIQVDSIVFVDGTGADSVVQYHDGTDFQFSGDGGTTAYNFNKLIDVTGNGYFSGNVGIGTTSPGTNLEIDETASGNAAEPILTMVNSDEGSTGETGQTVDVIFELAGSSDSGTSWTNQEAGKISSYKTADYWGADETDFDAGLKVYTVTDGAYVLAATFSDNDLRVPDYFYWEGTNFLRNSRMVISEFNGTFAFNQTSGVNARFSWELEDIEKMRLDENGNLGIGTIAPSTTLQIGSTSADDVQLDFSIVGDADSDAGGDTDDRLSITLTPNADPTLATWDFTSTQSAGYTFDNDINVAGDIITAGTTTWHVGIYDFVDGATYLPANAAAHPTAVNGIMYAPVKIPTTLQGGTVVIDQINIYFNTVDAGDDFDFALVRTDRDGTITTDEDEDNIGNGGTGNSNALCLGADLTLADYVYYIEIDVNNVDVNTDVKIYDIKITAHTE